MAMAPRVRLDQDCRDAKLAAAACDPTLIGQLQELLRRLLVSQREIIGLRGRTTHLKHNNELDSLGVLGKEEWLSG